MQSSRNEGVKLLPFNKDNDDLDAYLKRFERASVAFEMQPEYRPTQLARLLQGNALQVYQRLTDDEVDDHEVLKTQLLKRFQLTEGGYRKKFKDSKIELGESPQQLAERLRRYLENWRKIARYTSHVRQSKRYVLARSLFFEV